MGGPGSDTFCKASSEVCCVTKDVAGGGDAINQSCETKGFANCVTGLAIACDDSADCPSGQVCCGQLTNDGYHSVQCASSCTNAPGTTAVRFCDPDAATDECASIGRSCQPSTRLPGYSVCQ